MKEFILKRRSLVIPGIVVLIAIAVYFASLLPTADWYDFYPAARNVLSGHSPYDQVDFLIPPWGVLPLLPLALLPENLSHGLMFVISVLIMIYFMWKLKMPVLGAAAFMLSPTVVGALLVNNVDAFVIVGILLPPVWGLFLLVMKPQIGFGLVIYYLVDAWKLGGFPKIFKTFAPVGVVYLVSMALFPIWIDRIIHKADNPWNRALFPYAILLGVFLLWLAIRKRNPYFALAAAPFFAPYITFYSYFVVQLGLMHPDVDKYIRRDLLQIIFTIFLWVIMLTFHL